MKRNYCYVVIFYLLLTTCYLLLPSAVYAQTPEPWLGKCVENVPDVGEVATIQGFECLFKNVVRVLTPIAGLAVFIMLVVGSFQMLTAGGEVKEIQKARKTLTAAVLGLVVFIGIWFIFKLIETITGVQVTKFEMPK